MAVSINNKNGTTTKVATNVKIVKQPANHFMTKAVYDPDGEVSQAGGIPEYVAGEIAEVESQISEISETVGIHEERRNIFDYTDVTDDKYRASTLGSSINDSVDKANGWYSNQIWEVKKGDTIYQSTRWFPLLIYNEDGILVEYRTSGDTGGIYTITNDDAKYLTIQASAHTDEYLGKLMLSINVPLPSEYVPYTDVRTVSEFDVVEKKIPTDGRAILDKGFVILTFDAFDSVNDQRFDIVNEYGFKASVACTWGVPWADINKKVSAHGWDVHLYSGHNYPTADSYYVDNPSAEVQAVWDNYVKEEVDYALSQGVSNPTAWGCRQGKSCDGLENACKKYGIKMVRGGTKATKYTEKFSYSTNPPTSLRESTAQSCISAFTAAANVGYGVVFTTHGIYATAEEAEANYGMTEATLRQFLNALKALVDEGKLEVLTFREVYQKYYQNDALHNNYDRLAYRAFGNDLPTGGTTGQVLVKSSDADYDTEWGDGEKWANESLSTTYGNKFKKFCDNMDIDYEYDSATGANYSVIRIYRDRLDGKKQFPFVYAPDGAGVAQNSTYDLQLKDGWFLAINGGIFNTSTYEPDGIVVENGVVIHDGESTTLSQCRPLVIDGDGNMSEAAYDADAETLVQNGAVSVVCGFMAIVKDYEAVPQSEWNNIGHYVQNAQRQIIGQFGNGDYAIVTCEGRDYQHSDGWTIAEAQTICLKLGLKFAYNLDGGGSTETMIGFKHFNTIYERTTGRKVSTFIVFNGSNVFDKPERPAIYPGIITKLRFGPIYSSDGTKHCNYTSNRSSIWADGVTGLAFVNKDTNPDRPYYYAVEVPSNATSITVTIPNCDVGVIFCDSNGVKAWDVGWRDANEGLKLSFDMGKYAYATFNIRNKDNSNFTGDEDTSDWAVMFETTQQ